MLRWEQQLSTSNERNDYLNDELSSERQSNNVLRKKLESASNKLEEVSNQSNYLESLVLRYEQRVFELEELEVELKEKLINLEECLKGVEWWAAMILTTGRIFLMKFGSLKIELKLHFNLIKYNSKYVHLRMEIRKSCPVEIFS